MRQTRQRRGDRDRRRPFDDRRDEQVVASVNGICRPKSLPSPHQPSPGSIRTVRTPAKHSAAQRPIAIERRIRFIFCLFYQKTGGGRNPVASHKTVVTYAVPWVRTRRSRRAGTRRPDPVSRLGRSRRRTDRPGRRRM